MNHADAAFIPTARRILVEWQHHSELVDLLGTIPGRDPLDGKRAIRRAFARPQTRCGIFPAGDKSVVVVEILGEQFPVITIPRPAFEDPVALRAWIEELRSERKVRLSVEEANRSAFRQAGVSGPSG